MELNICKHGDGNGWCSLHKEYCHQGPCPDQEIITYAPVKNGKWEFGRNHGAAGYWCTNCQSGFTGENAEWIAKSHDYCPNCGASMEGD